MRNTYQDDWKRVSQLSLLGMVGLIAGLFDHGAWVWPAVLLVWTLIVAVRNVARPVRYVPATIATATLWSALILAVAPTSLFSSDTAFYVSCAVVLVSLVVILVDRTSSYNDVAPQPTS